MVHIVVVQGRRIIQRKIAESRQSPVAAVGIGMHDIDDLWQEMGDVDIGRQGEIDQLMRVVGAGSHREPAK
ncbi:hypothetical protein MMOR_53250 [Mycolicibacterium moriokaense]|uniref:Uncharacterized protein n=1 Tax=Mycolicibacterium moriokaense TaxID=39691 RepID=A0AAD1HGS2_9MYCO|nr:hypothetical protein MMOR_53250 [Mycolicibacterium moriokaense]